MIPLYVFGSGYFPHQQFPRQGNRYHTGKHVLEVENQKDDITESKILGEG
jgi:hypothetical protein